MDGQKSSDQMKENVLAINQQQQRIQISQKDAIFSEKDYAGFDTDAVRPHSIDIAQKLQDTAIVHAVHQKTVVNNFPNNTLEHRVLQHSERALPPMQKHVITSQAASAPRQRNEETAKIVDSEALVRGMTTSSDAIAYFARTPDKAKVKMVFCAPTTYQVDQEYEPYVLKVVSKKDTETLPVYYTINQNGVMRIVNNKNLAKFAYKQEALELRDRTLLKEVRKDQEVFYQKKFQGKVPIESQQDLKDEFFEQQQYLQQQQEEADAKDDTKIIYKKPDENSDDLESYLLQKKQPEIMNPTLLTDQVVVFGAFAEDSTEFVQLDRWILESSTYNILRNYRFFKDYYARRALEAWLKFTQYRNYMRNKSRIQFSSFFARKDFVKKLAFIEQQFVSIRDMDSIDIFAKSQEKQPAQNTACNRQVWLQCQQKYQQKLIQDLDSTNENVLQQILALCADLRKQATDNTDEENAKLPLFLKQKLMKTKSITATKVEQLLKRKQVKAAQEDLKSMYKFIFLIDEQFLEILLQMVVSNTQQLAEAIIKPPPTSHGLMQSLLKYNKDSRTIYFDPSLDEIQSSIVDTVKKTVDICNKPNQLCKIATFKEYYLLVGQEQPTDDMMNFAEFAYNDELFQHLQADIVLHIEKQKAILNTRVLEYEKLIPICQFADVFDRSQYIADHLNLSCNCKTLLQKDYWNLLDDSTSTIEPDKRADIELAFFNARDKYGIRPLEKEISKFRLWASYIQTSQSCYSQGFAQLDARNLQSEYSNVPQMGLDAIGEIIRKAISSEKQISYDKIRLHTAAISQQPSELEVFSNFIKCIEAVDDDMELLVDRVQLCDDLMNLQLFTNTTNVSYSLPQKLFNVVGQNDNEPIGNDQKLHPSVKGLEAKVDPVERASLETLHSELALLQQKRSIAQQFASNMYESQVQNLNAKIKEIKDKQEDYKNQLNRGLSVEPTSDATQVMKNLKDLLGFNELLLKNQTVIKQHADTIIHWQEQFLERKNKNKKQSEKDKQVHHVFTTLEGLQDELKSFKKELEVRLELWDHMNSWNHFINHLLRDPWSEIVKVDQKQAAEEKQENEEEKTEKDAAPVEKDADQIIDEKFQKFNAEKCVGYIQEEFKNSNRLIALLSKDKDPKDVSGQILTVANHFKTSVAKQKQFGPLYIALGNPYLTSDHWVEIYELLQFDAPNAHEPSFKMNDLLQTSIQQNKNDILNISSRATGEAQLIKQLEELQKLWTGTKCKCKDYTSRSGTVAQILTGIDDLYQQLDDSIATLQAMAGSRFISNIKDRVEDYEKRLTQLQEILDEWIKCQQAWLYLESIFAPEDIRRQLPSESTEFFTIDKFWRNFMEQAKSAPSIESIVSEDVKKNFQSSNTQLEKIQKRLEDYLETKRLAFPRFYFISNDELLQILAQTTEPATVIPFLRKIFEAINSITIEKRDGKNFIMQMISPEQEVIDFTQPVIPVGGLVEAWLTALEHEMFATVKEKMRATLIDSPTYGNPRNEWLFKHPAQCILAGGQTIFVDAIEGAFEADQKLDSRVNMERCQQIMIQQINDLSDMITQASKLQRQVIAPLIVIEIYSRDVIAQLLDQTNDNYSEKIADFGWQKQLRHYWVVDSSQPKQSDTQVIFKNTSATFENFDSGDLVFKQTDFKMISGYEYYGISQRLVVTPLTTKCYLTLTSALSKFYGGNPLGPAGTGKTETSKDLIKTLQVSCLIFNCSDGLDHKSMAKFFCGLAMTGSFSVFDEFNRILIETLSVISQQILTIQNAVRAKKTFFAFEQHAELSINTRVGFFITFNPDYEGRTALPENVKALFRPIAMIVPDYALIAENFLFSEGYKNGKILSRKMTQLYKLSSEQLSQQKHYDFGMRAIKSILYLAGKLKATATEKDTEENLLIRAMLDSNIPKFLADDIILFNGIVQDLFPGVKMPKTEYGSLETEIKQILVDGGYQANDEYVTKILQAYDTHIIRHGQMFVGDSMTGKSLARTTLGQAITNLKGTSPVFFEVEEYLLSAKSITMAELYGELNITTNEWKDGLIAVLARRMLEVNDKKIWLVMESHIDPVWIENLNTVLDDSKMFCLTNGERIRLSETSNLMFETKDLSKASPATVSRCGMVYFSDRFLSSSIVFKSLTLDNVEFYKLVFDLVAIEEFNVSIGSLHEQLKQLIDNKMVSEDDSSVSFPIENQSKIELKTQTEYPQFLAFYQFFEHVIHKMTYQLIDKLQNQFNAIFDDLIGHVRKNCEEEIRTLNFQLISNVVKVLISCIKERISFSKDQLKQQKIKEAKKAALQAAEGQQVQQDENQDSSPLADFYKQLPKQKDLLERNQSLLAPISSILLDQRLVFSFTWGVGGSIKAKDYHHFDSQFKAIVLQERKDAASVEAAAIMSLANNLPPNDDTSLTLFDFRLDNSMRYYVKWSDQTKLFGSKDFDISIINSGGSVFDIIVPTVDFVKYCTLTQSLIRGGFNVYLCGSTGTSKSSIVKTVFSRALGVSIQQATETKPEDGQIQSLEVEKVDYNLENAMLDMVVQEFPFSAQTNAESIENAIFERLEKKRKNIFGPASNRAGHVVFIDDADMPTPDKFGTQLPIELLRQIIFQSGTYDRVKLTFKQLQQVQMVLASQQAGAGRNEINSRFTSKFVTLGTPEMKNQAMISIFSTLLKGYVNTKFGSDTFSQEVKNAVEPSIYASIDLYNDVRQSIRATPIKSHYTFNLRDLARVIGGIFSLKPKDCPNWGTFMAVLAHEAQRVFRDRLISIEDEVKFDELLSNNFCKYFGPLGGQQTDESKPVDENQTTVDEDGEKKPLSIDFMTFGETMEKRYEFLNDLAKSDITPSKLMFGRWTGTLGLPTNQMPYKNLVGKKSEITQALTSIIDNDFDAPEELNKNEEIDFEALLNEKESGVNIRPVMFQDAIQHFSRMYRVLTSPNGHILCIGLSGSGRRTLLKLVASAVGAKMVEPTASRLYGVNEFYEDLKKCYLSAAEDKPTFLLMSETNLDPKDRFLEVINSLLNGVQLPLAIWKADEKEKVMNRAREIAAMQQEENTDGAPPKNYLPAELWSIFYRFARSQFHVCLLLSPIGDQLRIRLRQFPALVNCTSIDWFNLWDSDALFEVANSYLDLIHPSLLNQINTQIVSNTMVKIHDASIRTGEIYYAKTKTKVFVTPPLFMSFLQLFRSILSRSVGQLQQRQGILTRGLKKLEETSTEVNQMKKDLAELQPVLEKAAKETEELLGRLTVDKQEVGKIKEVVEKEESVVSIKVAEVDSAAKTAQAALDEVLPPLLEAEKQLEKLDKASIDEVKGFANPPEGVKLTMSAVCVLFKSPKTDWEASLKVLSDINFLKRLKEFDKKSVTQKMLQQMRKFTQHPKASVEAVSNSSKAAFSLIVWCNAIDAFVKAYEVVEPMEKKVAELQSELDVQQTALKVKQDELAKILSKLADLQRQYETSLQNRKELENKIDNTKLKLSRAEKIMDGLKSEYESWQVQINQISADLKASVGDALLASAVIAYLGVYASDERVRIINDWKTSIFALHDSQISEKLLVSDGFALENYKACADPRLIRQWKEQYKLPGDSGSIQSAIIATQSKRFPFFIDPELQGAVWTKLKEAKSNIFVTNQHNENLAKRLENCIRNATPVMIENASEDLDPLISSVLKKELIKRGNAQFIKLGDLEVDYNQDFKFSIATRIRKPQFSPDIFAFSQIVNMAVSTKGLEEQLLSVVVKVENPTLETERDQIVSQLADAKEKQKDIQDKLLSMLANSTGNVLEDENLINTLNESKVATEQITQQIEQGEVTTQKVNEQRELFRPVAIRGRILYDAMSGLSALDPMYQYSLDFFKNIFETTLKKVPAGSNKQEQMILKTTEACFLAVQRGIFERHKPIYAFMIASGIQKERKQIPSQLWNYFIGNRDEVDQDVFPLLVQKQVDERIAKNIAQLIYILSDKKDEFNEILTNFQKFDELIKYENTEQYITQDNSDPVIIQFLKSLAPFELLCFLSAINPIRLLFYLPIYTSSVMQQNIFIQPPNFNIQDTFDSANNITPLIFILSAGSDPMMGISQHVQSQGMQNRFFSLSLGQGQGEIADRMLVDAVKNGNWICLQNCHLCESWLPNLAKFVENMSKQIHQDFRLILTSMPSAAFPSSVLAQSIKIANEPPRSVKQNVLLAYQSYNVDSHDNFSEQPELLKHWKRLLFGLSFFYAQLLERKRFGPIGYSANYDYTIQDLQISQQFIRQNIFDNFVSFCLTNKFNGDFNAITNIIPMKPLNYMIGGIAFGGRISDFLDSRLVNNILLCILNENLFDKMHSMCPQNDNYIAPDFTFDYKEVINHIETTFPLVEKPSIFGLHENAELSYQLSESQNILKYVLLMAPSDAGGDGMTVQQIDAKVLQLADDMFKRVPQKLDASKIAMKKFIVNGAQLQMPSPLASVLKQECERYNVLLKRIGDLFRDVILAIQGLAIMSPELDQIYNGLLTNELPQVVKAASYPTLKQFSGYIADLVLRVKFFEDWINSSPSAEEAARIAQNGVINSENHSQSVSVSVLSQLSGFVPQVFWLGAFYFPHGFFTAVLQHHARIYALSIDLLSFETTPLNPDELRELRLTLFDGVILDGMKSEGARWDLVNQRLAEPFFGRVLEPMPPVWFKPVVKLGKQGKYAMPLYTTTNRFGVLSTTGLSTNYVMNMHLLSDQSENWWILRGAAAFI